MPILNLTIALAPGVSLDRRRLATGLTGLGADLLGKRPEATAVVINAVEPQDFFVAARPVGETALTAFSLDIRVTEGTNTAGEMADFIAAAFRFLEEETGPIEPVSYVSVVQVPAVAWGYGGYSQAERAKMKATGAPLSRRSAVAL
ncbi:MAG: 4-oxalocrotonate tautomerase [Hyphomicrobiales bacterium]|mgnify:CR=1 FL=1|nr:MAG: 4-oxalocrotonate tautomerase [Hyphomicrobiales bacterium]